jgi:hypothetical protein
MGPSLLKRNLKNDEKNKIKSKLYLSDFGRPSDRWHCVFRNPEDTVRNWAR